MGLRSWYTKVDNVDDFEKAVESIENKNPYSYGAHFILHMKEDLVPFLSGTTLIAWSGDGASSLKKLRPAKLKNETWLLDNLDTIYATAPDTIGEIYSLAEAKEKLYKSE